jgi:hypothetical protein
LVGFLLNKNKRVGNFFISVMIERDLLQSEDDPEWLADAMHELHPVYAWLAARREREEAEARVERTKTPEP